METVSRYPLDYDVLDKGDEFTVEELEKILRVNRNHKQFPFKLMNLQFQIERELEQRGLVVVVAMVRGNLRILTDPEAVSYTAKSFQGHRRGLKRDHSRAMAINVAALNDDQKTEHDRNIEVQSKYIQADIEVTKQLRLTSHQRTVPKLN